MSESKPWSGAFIGGDGGEWHFNIKRPCTTCKHRDGSCEVCGTTERRDAIHATRNGRGVVAEKLRKR